MKKGRFERASAAPVRRRRRISSAKLGLLILALTMLLGATFGGTLAYLTDTSGSVKNTFTIGNVGKLELKETTSSYVVVPGLDIKKDPTVTYSGNNINAYVFVQVSASAKNGGVWTSEGGAYSLNGKMTWTVDSAWTQLEKDVYYQSVKANASLTSHIIAGDKIYVSSTITESDIAKYASTLTFTAYAIQADGFASPAAAWAALVAQNS